MDQVTRWWFLAFFIFTPPWGNDPIWWWFVSDDGSYSFKKVLQVDTGSSIYRAKEQKVPSHAIMVAQMGIPIP